MTREQIVTIEQAEAKYDAATAPYLALHAYEYPDNYFTIVAAAMDAADEALAANAAALGVGR